MSLSKRRSFARRCGAVSDAWCTAGMVPDEKTRVGERTMMSPRKEAIIWRVDELCMEYYTV